MCSNIAAVLSILEVISGGSDRERASEADGLVVQVKSFRFLVCLVLFQKLFAITAKVSDVLQAEELYFAAAACYIEATIDTLTNLRK